MQNFGWETHTCKVTCAATYVGPTFVLAGARNALSFILARIRIARVYASAYAGR